LDGIYILTGRREKAKANPIVPDPFICNEQVFSMWTFDIWVAACDGSTLSGQLTSFP
jgi:hypothetical protein